MTKRKTLLTVIVLGVLLLIGLWFFWPPDRESDRVVISGNIELTEVDVAFKISGQLMELDVGEGDKVSKGTLIARLDQDQLLQQREQAAAQLKAAHSRLRELQSRLEFQRESLQARIEQHQADVRRAQAALEELLAGSRPQEIEQAQAVVDQARAEFQKAQSDWKGAQMLYEKDDISRSQFEEFKARFETAGAELKKAEEQLALVKEGPRQEDIRAARAGVAAAQAALKQVQAGRLEVQGTSQSVQALQAEVERSRTQVELIETQLADTQQVSPMDGVVLVKSADEGEVLAAGTPVVTIGDLAHPWLRGYIGESVLGRVKLGAPVRVSTDSYPGKVYQGRVSFIASEAEFTPRQIQTPEERVKLVYRIKVDIDNPHQELKLNMPVDAEILLPSRDHKGAVG